MKRSKKVVFQSGEVVAVEGEGAVEPIVLRVISDLMLLLGLRPLITVLRAAKQVRYEAKRADLDVYRQKMRPTNLNMKKSLIVKRV
jgi:hypothetical protein